jgi:negative regulator of flagellin synthesis FlgM
MHIHGTTHIHGPHGINAPHAPFRGNSGPSAPATSAADSLDISPAAEAAIHAVETGEIRQGLVDRIRSQISAGSYETPDKLNAAVQRLLDEIG